MQCVLPLLTHHYSTTAFTFFQHCEFKKIELNLSIILFRYVAGHAGFMYLTFDHEGNSSKMEHYAKMLRQNKMFEDDKSISFVVGDAVSI